MNIFYFSSFTGMYYVIYILEDQIDKTWYIGFTKDLKQRLKDHKSGHSSYTSKKSDLKLIYAEMYLNKADALGREKFLKSGSGHKFIKRQLANYFSDKA
jgi:putative endonuclease